MTIKNKNSPLFWFTFLLLLSGVFIIQTTLLSNSGTYSFIPYFIWPPLIFLFLHKNIWTSTFLVLFISILSGAFSYLSVPSLFLLYFLLFLCILFTKNFFFSDSPTSFFILVFITSWIFPYFVDWIHRLSIDDFSLTTSIFYLSKALATLALSIILFPFLKKQFQQKMSL